MKEASIGTIVFSKEGRVRAENKEIVEALQELTNILFEARSYYELWWIYLQLKSKSTNLVVLLTYKDFFETCGYSCISSLIVSLYKLYDKNEKVWDIVRLANESEKRNLLTPLEVSQMQLSLKGAELIWKKIVILRSNLFAHRSGKMTRENVYKKAKISPNNLRDLTDLSLEVLNLIGSKVYEKPKKFPNREAKDFMGILDVLRTNIK